MNRSRVTGDLASHGNIFVDIANDRVGIGSTIPGQKLSLPDNAKIALGNSADLQISHDGSHSIIQNTTGLLVLQDTSGLYLRSDDIRFQSDGGSETYATLTKNGAVSLNFDNNNRFQTKDYGVEVIGTTDTDGLVVSGVSTFSSTTTVTDGSSYSITSASSGVFSIAASEPRIRLIDNESNPNYSIYNTSGVFRIHDETTSTNRLVIAAAGKIGINQTSPYADVDITSSVEDADNGTLSEHGIRLAHVGAANEEVIPITAGFLTQQDRARAGIGFISKTVSSTDGLGGAIGFYTRNSADGTPLKRTDERVRITEAGRFGIGTNSPGSLFQVGTDTSGKLTFDGANTLAITGPEGGAARIDFIADQGDDAADKWRITNTSGNLFKIQRTTSHTDAVSIDTSGNITFSANSNVDGALRVNTNRTLSTQFHVVGGTGSGTTYDAAVFAGGQNSTQGSGVRIHLTGCENDPLNRGTVIEGVMTDNSNAHALVFKTSPSSAAPVERLRILSNGNIRQQKASANPNFTLSRNASIGNDEQVIGVIDFASNTAHTVQARVMARNHGTSNVGGLLSVETRVEGGSLTEKLRITGIGDIYAGNADTGGYAFFDNSTLRPRFQFRQGTGTHRGFAIIETRGDANGQDVFIAKSREGNGTGLINAGDNLGKINFAGADGTNMVNGAQIFAYTVSGKTVAANRMPTNLSFRTHDDNTSGLVERLRIEHDGGVSISNAGTFPASTSETLTVQGEGHNGHGTSNTRSVISITGAKTSNTNAMGIWIGARTNENTAVIGTRTSSGNLAVETYNSGWAERFRIRNNGKVVLSNSSGAMLDLQTSAGTGNCWVQLSDSAGNQKGYFGFGSSSNETLYIVQQESADIAVYTGSSIKWKFTTGGSFEPGANDSYDIGSSGNVVRNIFTGDLHLNNLSKEKGNDVDGTNGSWTIQEGQDDLYIINKLNGKKYRIPLEEVN